MKDWIYLDHAATTKLDSRVLEEMLPYMEDLYGNPSSLYGLGKQAHDAIQIARKQIADSINATSEEIYFTSGGTESDNWALRSAVEGYAQDKGMHIITSSVEHHAVLRTLRYLEDFGFEVTYLPVDENGLISIEDLEKAIRPDTVLISIMFANNEIGTIEPIQQIGKIAYERGILFHTDAVQAFGNTLIDVNKMHIDFLSASAHKFYGPKGVGFLYARKGLKLFPMIYGGDQESQMRAGTENVPGIVGMGKAAELVYRNRLDNIIKTERLRDYLIEEVLKEIPDSKCNGSRYKRLPGNANFSFVGVDGETLMQLLDMQGIYVSSGAACNSDSIEPSHVLKAIGLSDEMARSSIRISLGNDSTKREIDATIKGLKRCVETLRKFSEIYK